MPFPLAQVTAHPLLEKLAPRSRSAAIETVALLEPCGRAALGFLWHHRVRGRALMPGTAMCEMAAAACQVGVEVHASHKRRP